MTCDPDKPGRRICGYGFDREEEPLSFARFRERYEGAGRLRDIPPGWEDVEPGDVWVVNGETEYVSRVDHELGVVEVQ